MSKAVGDSHFISVSVRTPVAHEDVAKIEDTIRVQMDTVTANLNKVIDGAEALFKAHGITSTATHRTPRCGSRRQGSSRGAGGVHRTRDTHQ